VIHLNSCEFSYWLSSHVLAISRTRSCALSLLFGQTDFFLIQSSETIAKRTSIR